MPKSDVAEGVDGHFRTREMRIRPKPRLMIAELLPISIPKQKFHPPPNRPNPDRKPVRPFQLKPSFHGQLLAVIENPKMVMRHHPMLEDPPYKLHPAGFSNRPKTPGSGQHTGRRNCQSRSAGFLRVG
jgi:hypothetical protein